MKMLRNFLLLFSMVAMFSCTYGAQTYGPVRTIRPSLDYGPYNYGYSEVPIDSITYQVTFASTDGGEEDRLSLYRSAELTDQHGFNYFIVSASEGSAIKTIRMYKGATPTDNPSAYNAKSMLAVMGPTINK